jgi:hypothetical protein
MRSDYLDVNRLRSHAQTVLKLSEEEFDFLFGSALSIAVSQLHEVD